MRTKTMRIRRLSALCAASACALLGLGAASASAATPSVTNVPPGAGSPTSVPLQGTVATESTLSECRFEYFYRQVGTADTGFGAHAVQSAACASSDGTPIAGPAEVPADSSSHAIATEVPLPEAGLAVDYRLSATNADGTAVGPGFQSSGFGINTFDGSITDAAGNQLTKAAAHPAEFTTAFDFNLHELAGYGPGIPVEDVHDVVADLPPGFVGATAGLPQCNATELAKGTAATNPTPECDYASQVGVLHIRTSVLGSVIETAPVPVFNMVPPPGAPARFGANAAGALIMLDTVAVPGPGGGYVLRTTSADIPQAMAIVGNTLTIWGVPSAPSHDSERACPGQSNPGVGGPVCNSRGEEIGAPGTDPAPPAHVSALFRTPTSCTPASEGLQFGLRADSWEHPGGFDEASYRSHESPFYPEPPESRGPRVGIEGCEDVPFEPTIATSLTTNKADSPTGLNVDLGLPRDCWDPKTTPAEVEAAICQSDLKESSVTLPQGLSLNPAAAGGRAACTPAQAGVTSALGSSPVEFDNAPVSCPDASKIGSVKIETPLLDTPLEGSVYLAQQSQNPFKSLLAMYLVAEVPGVRIKQAGEISLTDSGQVTTSFASVPQTPFSKIHLELFGGSGAALRTPSSCGEYTTTSTLTPWSGNAAAHPSSSFQISEGCGGGFDPKLRAGTQNPLAGSYSPFTLKLTREDGTQELAGLQAALPPGLIGKPAGIPYCPDAVLAAISGEIGTGAAQETSPSCPAASQLGTVTVGAGAGLEPFYTSSGRAYLAGPYKGAPLSLAVVAPAVAGPFDLGNVVVRNALQVNPETAQITAVSDPIPTIVHGIPLDLRDVRIDLNRNEFTLNPTSCEPLSIDATLTSAQGATAQRSNHFQAAACERLGFKPQLALKLRGGTKRGENPALTAVLQPRGGDANIASLQAALPHSEFLAQNHIKTVCTRVQFAADQCPAGSIYGKVTATTPLLDFPLSGPVYLRSSSHKLPDLVLAMHGPASQPIEIDAVGRIDSVKGGIRTSFEAVPDAPLTKVVLRMQGAKKSLLQNSRNLCLSTARATVGLDAQNARSAELRPQLAAKCGAKAKKHAKRR